jgi:hypothetical protein
MSHGWRSTTFTGEAEMLDTLTDLSGKRWLSRGQAETYGRLQPSIDRAPRERLTRVEKLRLERQSIDIFRSTARSFGPGEGGAMYKDVVALMVMRHYGVPTRLLDWSLSPFVAAYFASEKDGSDGEIWSFSYDKYIAMGNEQWNAMPGALRDGKWEAEFSAFTADDPPDWFACNFYAGFPRQDAQRGLYSMTARFGRGHEEAIATLLRDPDSHSRFVVPSSLKPRLRQLLREQHGIWRGSLFPDSAGAAETVISHIFAK